MINFGVTERKTAVNIIRVIRETSWLIFSVVDLVFSRWSLVHSLLGYSTSGVRYSLFNPLFPPRSSCTSWFNLLFLNRCPLRNQRLYVFFVVNFFVPMCLCPF